MKRIIFSIITLCVAFAAAQAQTSNAEIKRMVNEAVLQVYNEELAQNPTDYNTLNARANQYFLNDDFLRALDDVSEAIRLTPEKESELLYDELMLRAKIYAIRGDINSEIADLQLANKIDPTAVNCLGLLAQAYYDTENYESAKTCYRNILRLNPTNYDAMAGQARIEVKLKNFGSAAEHVDKAVKLFPADPQVYINRAEVLLMMDQYEAAAQDLISALGVGEDNSSAIAGLTDMSDVYYDAVMSALQNSIDKAPRNGMYYYVRAEIALGHFHYADAAKDLQAIIDNNLYDYHGIFFDAATAYFNICNYAEALSNINKAIMMTGGTAEHYVLKSRILRATKKTEEADRALNMAITVDADYLPAYTERARVHCVSENWKDAVADLNNAIMIDPSSAENMLLRGWIQKYKLENKAMAEVDFNNILLGEDDIYSLRGFALYELGQTDGAVRWMADIINAGILPGGECYIYAASLSAYMGDNDKAIKHLESALANGYDSKYELQVADYPVTCLKPLRSHPRFNTLLTQYIK